MTTQSPIKVSGTTKERIRYLAAVANLTQGEIVDQAVQEYAARHADMIENGIDQARSVLLGGNAAIAAHLLDVPTEAIQLVGGRRNSL